MYVNHQTIFNHINTNNMKHVIITVFAIGAFATVNAQTVPVRTSDPSPATAAAATKAEAPVKATDATARQAASAPVVEVVPVRKSDPNPAAAPANTNKAVQAKDKVPLPSEQAAPAAAPSAAKTASPK